MGLLRKAKQWGRALRIFNSDERDPHASSTSNLRICHFEQLEARQVRAGDIHLGAVYFEEATGDDSAGDRLEITFQGGAPGTQLHGITLNGDKLLDGGLTLGDIFFDTADGGLGSFKSDALNIVSHNGFTITNVSVQDGSSLITFEFAGFDAGEKLVFDIDVDEQGLFGSTSVTEGGEFEGTRMTGVFKNNHFEDATGTAIFYDAYDAQFAAAAATTGSQLGLPPDNYIPPHGVDRSDRTAGAVVTLVQVPKPITIAGTVFHDPNLSNSRDPGELGISGVSLSLLQWNGTTYISTGKTTVTNAVGEYKFDGILPGTYRVVESQPSGYLSVGSKPGSVNGAPVGVSTSVDVLSEITLLGGQDSIQNDFAEVTPGSISGKVYADPEGDCVYGPNDTPLSGVKIELLNAQGSVIETTFTDANGNYQFTNLMPANYGVRETQPAGYYQGGQKIGSSGGVISAADVTSSILLTAGTGAIDYDFCELLPASLAGKVYADPEGDCIYGPNDTPLAGVTIELLNAQGVVVATTLTNAQGQYKFDNLAPGTYGVREVQPIGYYQGGTMIGSAGGAITAADLITQITLGSSQHAVNYDFCETIPGSISGKVYADPEGDCVYGPNDIPLSGIAVQLLDVNNNVIATTFTNLNGEYSFDNLPPGSYGVREIQPAGYFQGGTLVGSEGGIVAEQDLIKQIVITSATDAVNYDFCENLPASLSGRVYADPEADCVYGPNDIPLSGVKIELLDEHNIIVATTFTDAEGKYKFEGLAPTKYTVKETQPVGYFQGGTLVGSAGGVVSAQDVISQVTLTSGLNAIDYDFCENIPARISGKVYADPEADCVYGPNDTPLVGVTIELLGANGEVLATTLTDANGNYKFDGLAPGTYSVREVQPAGYYQGGTMVGSSGGVVAGQDLISGIVLTSDLDAVNYDFCENIPGTISGKVYADPEGDCVYGPNDIPLSGVTIELLNASGDVIGTTLTDAAGKYKFEGLAPGSYSVRELQPNGYYQGGTMVGSVGGVIAAPDLISQVVIVSATNGQNYDFCENIPASISGRVHADLDGDCQFDPGELLLVGVKIELLDANGVVIATTFTDAFGEYKFEGLAPGTYGVHEVQPNGYFQGDQQVGTAGGVKSATDYMTLIVLGSADAGLNYDFCEVVPGSISGRVFGDLDGDCLYDPGELPLAGLRIDLLDVNGNVISTAYTNAQGQYKFDGLAPGSYGVFEHQPAAYADSGETIGSAGGVQLVNDRMEQIVITSGRHGIEYNFCELPLGSLSGYVFQDGPTIVLPTDSTVDPTTLRDGVRSAGDKPIAGVIIMLGDASGNPILDQFGNPRYAVTDANGYYQFTGLLQGLYTVREIQPSAFIDSIDKAGSTGGWAVNPNGTIDPLILQQLTVAHNFDAIVRIPVGPGAPSVENNFSEIQVVRADIPPQIYEPPVIAPIKVYSPPGVLPLTPEKLLPIPLLDFVPQPFIAGNSAIGYTWHLSVIDAGDPRGSMAGETLVQAGSGLFNVDTWTGADLQQAQWSLIKDDGLPIERPIFGAPGAIPLSGDFNGDGRAEIGVFIDGEWFIDINANGVWDEGDLWAKLGTEGDKPVVGDWDGDGKDDIGIFGRAWAGDPRAILREPGLPHVFNNKPKLVAKNLPPKKEDAPLDKRTMKVSTQGALRADLIDHVFSYGVAGDRAIAGDWAGNGVDCIGVFRNGAWHFDMNGDGLFGDDDVSAIFGQLGDLPIVGDWDNNGVDDIGVYRAGKWILDTNSNRKLDAEDKVIEMGSADDTPIVGDWAGDGRDRIGLYHFGRIEHAAAKDSPVITR